MMRSWLGTIIFRRYVAAIGRRAARREERESRAEGRSRRIRAWLIRHGDPVVMMPVGRQLLVMPLSHALPTYRAMFASYDRLLPNLARVLQEANAPLNMIDVGANVGDTMALVQEYAPNARFLCVEGHRRYADLLRTNARRLQSNADIVEAYCDDGSGAAWQVSDDAHGTARLARASDAAPAVRTTTLDQLRASNSVARDVTLLKIDTDGSDLRVLRGAARLLRDSQPIVYVEFHPRLLRASGDDPAELFPLLVAAGYTRARLYTNRGAPIGTFALEPLLLHDAESHIDGRMVEYLDILAWTPAHETIIAQLNALEANLSRSPRP